MGAAAAALIPLDDRELLLPGSEELIGKWTQRVARPAVEHEHDRIPTTVVADGDPLGDAADGDEAPLFDPLCGCRTASAR
jgi:hypothetical protein